MRLGADLLNSIDIYYERTADADELGGRELLLKLRQRAAEKMNSRSNMQF